MRILCLSFLILMIAMGGCKSSKVSYPRDIVFENILRNSQGPTQRGLYVLHSAADLQKLNMNLPPELKNADFKKGMYILVAAGEKPTGGHGIEIAQIRELDNSIEVFFRETIPAKDAFVTMAVTYPFHVVRIGHSNKNVNFNQKTD